MSKSKEARGILLLLSLVAWSCVAARYSTPNFVVTAPTPEFAKQVGDSAEQFRKDLAIEWLGAEFPHRWSAPCPIQVKVGQIGAGGATSFSFDRDAKGETHVFGWTMTIQGSEERILDSVLPHEITHMILACHFRCPLPRWADEGAATLAEHESEKLRQVHTTKQVLNTRQRIPLRKLVGIMQYPNDMREVLTLYAEGYCLAELLVQKGGKDGKARYLRFLGDALRNGWDAAVKKHYGYRNLDDLEMNWNKWIAAGSPALHLPEGQALAQENPTGRRRGNPNLTVRGQNPDETFGSSVAVASTDMSGRGSPLSAPSPRRGAGNRVRRTKVSSPTVQLGSASLGEPADVGNSSSETQPLSDDALPPAAAPARTKSLNLGDETTNPGWATVDESASSRSNEPTPGRAVAYESRGQGTATQEDDDASPRNSGTADVTRDSQPNSDATSAEDAPRPAKKPLRSITAYPQRKPGAPRWSEFPQIARPSPFTDLPTVSRQ